jgi:putative ABC transport system permease protein
MRLSSYVRGSLVQLRSNLFRTLLTLLGIVFGVASVIAMITIGEGAQAQILQNIEAMGATLVHVVPSGTSEAHVSQIVNASLGLSWRDVAALRDTLARPVVHVSRVKPKVTSLAVQATDLQVFAVSPGFAAALDLQVLAGRHLTDSDAEVAAPLALVTESYAQRFFGGVEKAVGRRVRVDAAWLEVAGVVGSRQFGAAGGEVKLPTRIAEYRDALFVLESASHTRLAPPPVYGPLDKLVVKCRSLDETKRIKGVVERVLARTHQATQDYTIVAPQELMDQQEAAQKIFNVVLLSIAAISLLVGGIGIMNIMLANVLERRSEIGVRRALGAKRRHIVTQFLLESTMICSLGGVLGILLGVGISYAILTFTKIPIAFSATPIAVSCGISVLVGLVFGIMPARQAAATNPVEALHSE